MSGTPPPSADPSRGPARGTLTLVLGGVRSGKSDFARSLAHALAGDDVVFVATAEAGDAEMRHRIDRHRRDRPSAWRTLEAPRGVAAAVESEGGAPAAVLVDCLTLLVSNLVCAETGGIDGPGAVDRLEQVVRDEVGALASVADRRRTHVIVVSGEVGQGVVPESGLGRLFRDLLGMANRMLSREATATYLLVAGHAVPLHALATGVPEVAGHLRDSRGGEGRP